MTWGDVRKLLERRAVRGILGVDARALLRSINKDDIEV